MTDLLVLEAKVAELLAEQAHLREERDQAQGQVGALHTALELAHRIAADYVREYGPTPGGDEHDVLALAHATIVQTAGAALAHDTAVAQRAQEEELEPARALTRALALVKAEYAWCSAEGGFEMDQNKAAQAELEKLISAAIQSRDAGGRDGKG